VYLEVFGLEKVCEDAVENDGVGRDEFQAATKLVSINEMIQFHGRAYDTLGRDPQPPYT
jgi:hypothetical protein